MLKQCNIGRKELQAEIQVKTQLKIISQLRAQLKLPKQSLVLMGESTYLMRNFRQYNQVRQSYRN